MTIPKLTTARDHPRVGGEKPTFFPLSGGWKGSPPRGRGKETGKTRRVQWPGITPAWAGKSRGCARGQTRARDHPREGGEKQPFGTKSVEKCGSPPRGRGKAGHRPAAAARPWITPAWAGKSRSFIRFHFFGKDHPRVGGEKTTDRPQGQAPAGSPPRGRGKVRTPYGYAASVGITPAWAGKSSWSN